MRPPLCSKSSSVHTFGDLRDVSRAENTMEDGRPLEPSRYRAQRAFHHLDLSYPGLDLVHEEPYIFVVHDFLSSSECTQLLSLAGECQQQASATAPEQEARRT